MKQLRETLNGCHSPEVQPLLEDQEGLFCLGIPVYYKKGNKSHKVASVDVDIR